MAWIVLALRRVRADLVPTLGLVVLVLVTALVAALAPRVLAALADGAIRDAIAGAPPAARSIVLIQNRIIADGPRHRPAGRTSAEAGADARGRVPGARQGRS